MKRTLLAVALTGAIVAPQVQAADLSSDQQKLSYSMGLVVGNQLKQNVGDVDQDSFQAGFKDALSGSKPELSQEEISQVLQNFQKQKMAEQKAALEKASADNKKAGADYMAANAKKKGVVTTDSGLQYQELRAGKGPHPKPSDTVKVNYKGTLIDGTVFDSSYERNKPVTFELGSVIPGWQEGLQKMRKGGKARLVIPAKLAYGDRPMGPSIKPGSTLVFEVELLDINPKDSDS